MIALHCDMDRPCFLGTCFVLSWRQWFMLQRRRLMAELESFGPIGPHMQNRGALCHLGLDALA